MNELQQLEAKMKDDFRVFLTLVWREFDLPKPTSAQLGIATYLLDMLCFLLALPVLHRLPLFVVSSKVEELTPTKLKSVSSCSDAWVVSACSVVF